MDVGGGAATATAATANDQDAAAETFLRGLSTDGVPNVDVGRAAKAALAVASASARDVREREERELQRLVCLAVELQLQKMQVKMQRVAELEAILESERLEVCRLPPLLFCFFFAVCFILFAGSVWFGFFVERKGARREKGGGAMVDVYCWYLRCVGFLLFITLCYFI